MPHGSGYFRRKMWNAKGRQFAKAQLSDPSSGHASGHAFGHASGHVDDPVPPDSIVPVDSAAVAAMGGKTLAAAFEEFARDRAGAGAKRAGAAPSHEGEGLVATAGAVFEERSVTP